MILNNIDKFFSGTSAIKYRVNSSKTWRALLLEEEVYHPPDDGWGERVYTCAQPQKTENKTPDGQQSIGQFFSSGSSLDPVVASPLTYSHNTNSLVSPFMGLHGPLGQLGQVWSTSVTPGQSVFGNIGALGHPGTGGFGKNS